MIYYLFWYKREIISFVNIRSIFHFGLRFPIKKTSELFCVLSARITDHSFHRNKQLPTMPCLFSVGSGSSYTSENMFDTANHASLNTWSDNHKLCVCPGSHTSAEKICGAQEDQTCANGDVVRTGTVVSRSTSSRRKRDVDSAIVPYHRDMYQRGDLLALLTDQQQYRIGGNALVPSDFEYSNHYIVKVGMGRIHQPFSETFFVFFCFFTPRFSNWNETQLLIG